MKSSWSRAVVALALLLSGPSQAAENIALMPPPDDLAPVQTPAPAPVVMPDKITIAPHRAVYTMNLGSVKNGSSVTDVAGQMAFEWSDTCDGWAVQQHLQLHFNYAEGDEANVNSDVVSWEAKNGKSYNFNVRRTTNGKETENYRGRATLGEHGGSGTYTVPKDKKAVELPADSLFPSAHTILILQHALEGDKLFTRRVFDGSDELGVADVSAFIGQRLMPSQTIESSAADLRDNPLLRAPSWPIRLAFYKPESQTGEPDYEMDLTLLPNGVARSMRIDYGDFSVSGALLSLEALPASDCK